VGIGAVNTAVADAGPLIHLTEIGCLPLLRIFDILHIPEAVWWETVRHGRVEQGEVLGLGTVQQHTLSHSEVMQFTQERGYEELQDGERQCLYLCQQVGVSILLTDDLAVREQAKRLNVTPIGSLGVVVRAYRVGQISLANAERHIIDLYDVSSLFVTRAIVELAIEHLHKHPNQD
jgi:predicted nucleic acid-binding protein